jgi:ABC-type Fe3+ transport system permease subunit
MIAVAELTFIESLVVASKPCMWTFLRSAVVAGAALWIGQQIKQSLSTWQDARLRRIAWTMLLLPILTPAILVGYAYSDFALSMVHHPVLNTLCYLAIMTARLTPLVVLVLYFAPPAPLSAQALHCASLAQRSSVAGIELKRFWMRAGLWWRGPWRNRIAALSLAFLLAFQEFEISSQMGVKFSSWTEKLFDLQAVSPTLSKSLTWALPPLLIQLLVLAPLLWVVLAQRATGVDKNPSAPKPSASKATMNGLSPRGIFSWLYLSVSVIGASLGPFAIVGAQSVGGWSKRGALLVVTDSIIAAAIFASAGSVLAFLICWQLLGSAGSGLGVSPLKRLIVLGLCVPGLLGSLLVGLGILAIFTLIPGYDTPLPLLLGLMVWLLPAAMLLMAVAGRLKNQPAVHTAKKLQTAPAAQVRRAGQKIQWHLVGQRRTWVILILFLLAYFELSASAILSPVGMTPVAPVLYNLMHNGQNAVMSASVILAVALSAMILFIAHSGGWLVQRLWSPHE